MGEMIERLDFSGKGKYSAVEATIHLNRYAMARPYVAGKRVLDVASGEGYGSFLLRRWGAESVEGIDVDEQTVET
ncbi:MAG: class I SAM-dependent methyltransferase, partial [Christensenellales bacterium]